MPNEKEDTIKPVKFMRGAKPTPRHKLAAAVPFQITDRAEIPSQVAYVPKKLSFWLNNQYGDCVTAEEAFNQDVSGIFIQDSVVQAWARKGGFLDGATLTDVMDAMARSGFPQDGKVYGIGAYNSVDYSNESVLQAALAIAPVKIGIDANALPSGAGNNQGWDGFGGQNGQFQDEDHCVALCGYGPASFLFAQLGVSVPSGVDPAKPCYLLFTWNTIGVVDHAWIMSTVAEAWLRNPSVTVNGTPLPNPGPQPEPIPVPPTPPTPVPVPPTPTPIPNTGITLPLWAAIAALAGGLAVGFLVGRVTKS